MPVEDEGPSDPSAVPPPDGEPSPAGATASKKRKKASAPHFRTLHPPLHLSRRRPEACRCPVKPLHPPSPSHHTPAETRRACWAPVKPPFPPSQPLAPHSPAHLPTRRRPSAPRAALGCRHAAGPAGGRVSRRQANPPLASLASSPTPPQASQAERIATDLSRLTWKQARALTPTPLSLIHERARAARSERAPRTHRAARLAGAAWPTPTLSPRA
jgi:hypothetical protein